VGSREFDIIPLGARRSWNQGNIGATEGGLPFLEDEDIIPDLIRISEESQVLSIRGYVSIY
jgi:hypothetical protein